MSIVCKGFEGQGRATRELAAAGHLLVAFAESDDPNRTNAYVLSNDGPHGDYTAKRIDHTPATDLVCAVN